MRDYLRFAGTQFVEKNQPRFRTFYCDGRKIGPFAIATLLLFLPVAVARADKPVLTVAGTSVRATAIKKGATIIWVGASVEPFNGNVRLWHVVKTTRDEDGDRSVSIDHDVTPFSVFLAVEAESGDYAAIMADGSLPPVLEDRSLGGAWQRNAAYLDFEQSDVVVLLVRPDVGAWFANVSQGSYADGDGRHDGNLRVALRRMTPVYGSAPAPPLAESKDLLVAIDRHTLATFVRQAKEKN